MFRLNVTLLVLLVLLVAGALLLRRDPEQRTIELMPDMQYSPAYDAYRPNPNFANGRTLQAQPPGTIARGQLVLHYEATPQDAVRAGEELSNPLPANDPGVLAAGRELYGAFCALCHGHGGLGDGPVTKRGYPPPPSLLTGKATPDKMKDGQLFHIISYGQGGMAPYASQISPNDRWRIVAFVRDMQAKHAASQESNGQDAAPENPAGQPAEENTKKNADKNAVQPNEEGQP